MVPLDAASNKDKIGFRGQKKKVQWLVKVHDRDGRFYSPAFCNSAGMIIKPQIIELGILDRLQWVQDCHCMPIPTEVNIYEEFGITRSFQWGVTTEAQIQNVSE